MRGSPHRTLPPFSAALRRVRHLLPRRIKHLSSREDLELEKLRQDLRDQRWLRHRSMLRTTVSKPVRRTLLIVLVLVTSSTWQPLAENALTRLL